MPRRQSVQVTFSLEGWIREDKDAGCFVSFCPALNVYSAARTRLTAKEALKSAVLMYVRICYDRKILGGVLASKGFELAPVPVGPRGEYIAVGVSAVHDLNVPAMMPSGSEYDDAFKVEVPLYLVAQQQAQVGA